MKYTFKEYLVKILERFKLKKIFLLYLDKFNKYQSIDLSKKIKSICIDTTNYESDLCRLGKKFNSDKSPLNSDSPTRHSYTGIYNFLFSSIKESNLIIGEFGILNNASMKMWREYFKNAKLIGFEYDKKFIEDAKKDKLKNTFYYHTDVNNKKIILETLKETNELFDIIIDDSNHLFESQINIIEISKEFIKPGGLLIIEDIYTTKEKHEEIKYYEEIKKYMNDFSEIYFINCNHKNNYNRLYPHNKILFLKKN